MANRKSKNSKITHATLLAFCCALVFSGCSSAPPPPPPDTRAADEAAVRKADENWSAAAKTNQVDAWVAYYSDDAVVFPPNDAPAASKDSIRKTVGEFLAMPGLSVSWKTAKVEAARSGDVAFSYGAYEMTAKGPKGKPVMDHGKYLEVWKKQPDGEWKCSEDIWNSDLPATPPAK
jgi:ketosteroid isomerase-like protein